MRPLKQLDLDNAAFVKKYGPWVVIAGASEGTGSAYAEELAAMGLNLVLVSRRKEALEELGGTLKAAHGIEYRAIVQDLTEAGAGNKLVAQTDDLDVGLYISNAGADGAGNSFIDEPAERAHRLVGMNITTLIDAVHGFASRMRTRGGGGILIMASGAGLGGQPLLTMYSATKSFELTFAESLWAEWEAAKIDVLGVAAPIMLTPTLERATAGMGFDTSNAYNPAEVTHNALSYLLAREPLMIVPDGPGEEKLPAIEAARKERLVALAEFSKAYTGG